MPHTPGPWEFTPGPKGEPDFEDCDFIVGEARDRGEAIATIVGPIRLGTPEGNANLIAAAPDLLSAAKNALVRLDREDAAKRLAGTFTPDDVAGSVNDQLRAAIAKAEGR